MKFKDMINKIQGGINNFKTYQSPDKLNDENLKSLESSFPNLKLVIEKELKIKLGDFKRYKVGDVPFGANYRASLNKEYFSKKFKIESFKNQSIELRIIISKKQLDSIIKRNNFQASLNYFYIEDGKWRREPMNKSHITYNTKTKKWQY